MTKPLAITVKRPPLLTLEALRKLRAASTSGEDVLRSLRRMSGLFGMPTSVRQLVEDWRRYEAERLRLRADYRAITGQDAPRFSLSPSGEVVALRDLVRTASEMANRPLPRGWRRILARANLVNALRGLGLW